MNFNLLSNYIKPENLIDIGANVRNFTFNISKLTNNLRSIMIEANPYCEKYLGQLEHPYHMIGLSNHEGFMDLYVEKFNSIGTGASFYRENTNWYEEGKYELVRVPVNILDNLNLYPSEMVDLIKIDVQGSELDILSGGNKTIKRSKYVLMEVSTLEYNLKAPLLDKIVEKMREYFFKIEDILDYRYINNQIFQMDFLFKNIYI